MGALKCKRNAIDAHAKLPKCSVCIELITATIQGRYIIALTIVVEREQVLKRLDMAVRRQYPLALTKTCINYSVLVKRIRRVSGVLSKFGAAEMMNGQLQSQAMFACILNDLNDPMHHSANFSAALRRPTNM